MLLRHIQKDILTNICESWVDQSATARQQEYHPICDFNKHTVSEIDKFSECAHLRGMTHVKFYRALGATVRHQRKSLDKTQQELADLIGLSRASIANIETGRQQVLVHQLYALASALELEAVSALLPEVQAKILDDDELEALPMPSDVNDQQKEQLGKLILGATKSISLESGEESN